MEGGADQRTDGLGAVEGGKQMRDDVLAERGEAVEDLRDRGQRVTQDGGIGVERGRQEPVAVQIGLGNAGQGCSIAALQRAP